MGNYKRPEDEYSKPRAREMIKQLEEEKKKLLCKGSTPAPSKELMYKNYPHVGVITHICELNNGHEGKCQCICGVEFYFIPHK